MLGPELTGLLLMASLPRVRNVADSFIIVILKANLSPKHITEFRSIAVELQHCSALS